MNKQQTQSYIREVAAQTAMALTSEKTPNAVKDCLKTIIFEAATEADSAIFTGGINSESVKNHLPNIIEKLPVDYGRGFLHSIAAIVRHDSPAFQGFYDQRLDKEPTATATARTEPKQTIENDMTNNETQPKPNPLDDLRYATEKRLEMLELAKEMIAQILTVTAGYSNEPPDKEFAQKYLFAIFEMFTIRHDNFSRSMLAEDLQSYLFTWTRAHDDSSQQWRSDVLSELKFQDLHNAGSAAIPKDAGKPQVLDSIEQAEDAESLNALANQFAEIMQNPNLPRDIYNVLTDEFARIQNPTDTPENILLNLKALSEAEKAVQNTREAKSA